MRHPAAAAVHGLVLLVPAAAAGAPLFAEPQTAGIATANDARKFTMAASAADLDGDGDLDLALASEYAANRILLNEGDGTFRDVSDTHLARTLGDHEDVAIADYDRDGDLDLAFVGEDDQVQGYHLNDGCARFTDVTDRLPARGISNAVVAADFDGDGDADLYIGNNGQDFVFINDGTGQFADETEDRLPVSADVTQDVAAGDVDADGDLDIVLGNEDGNVLLRNDGTGSFSPAELPLRETPEETRDADLADVDGDGDLDLYLANTALFTEGADAQDRLLINDGSGVFTDMTADYLEAEREPTMTAAFLDFDVDGDLDLVTGSIGDLSGRTAAAPYRTFVNDGTGRFTAAFGILPEGTTGNGFDIEAADLNGDAAPDLFLASRGGPDRVLLSTLAPGEGSPPSSACED